MTVLRDITLHRGALPTALATQIGSYVDSHPRASLYHTPRWVRFAGEVFGFESAWLLARAPDGTLVGALPLVCQRSLVFGRRWVSMPFFNYGGPLGSDAAIEGDLLDAAAQLGRSTGARTVEIRDTVHREGLSVRTEKAGLVLDLPGTPTELGKALGAKLRSQIRRADRESPSIHVGGAELVPDFFSVFAPTMRDLGTPVYPIGFFTRLLNQVGSDCRVVVVRLGNRPAAAALLTRWRNTVEVPWAASLHELRSTSVNMRLYWECLSHAIHTGATQFDFGRSTIDAGTYRFKLQWGAKPCPLYWYYPMQEPGHTTVAGDSRMVAAARRAWTHLPLPIANLAGRLLSPGLPW